MPTYPIQLKRNGTAAATPSSLLHGEVALNYADGKLFWKDSSNVIQSFTFQAYALSSHTHAASDVTSGTLDAARLPLATTGAAGAVIVGTGLGVSSGTVSVTYGTTAGTSCQGNDSRLSDTRTPTDGSVTTAKIANDAVTYAKLQNVSATDRILGRSSSGAGPVEEITCTAFGRSLIDDADAAAARTTLSVQPTASPAFTDSFRLTAGNAVFDGIGNCQIFTSTAQASDRGGQLSLGGVNGSAGAFDPWAFGVIRGAKENSTSANFAGYLAFGTANAGGTIAERLRINSSGQLLVTAGSASAPGVAISGDPDTGIAQLSAAGANTISICTNSAERVRVDASGNVGIGVSADATTKLHIGGTYPTSGTVTRAILCNGLVPSGSTVFGDGLVSFIGTVAASFTCANLRHFVAAQGSIGAGSSVTSQFGYVAESSLTGATNNYGFYSDIASGSNRWNFYANGSAKNYFNGETLIGTTTDNGAYLLQVNSQIYATNATIATSDARFKTRVESLADATAVIEALRPVAFDFIPQEERNFATERQVGLIAQEAQAALAGTDYADSVVAQCGDHLGLAYEKLVPVLIKALQESNARIAALEERLNHA